MIFILLGMCMIAYIALLFFNLIQQMSGFVVHFLDRAEAQDGIGKGGSRMNIAR